MPRLVDISTLSTCTNKADVKSIPRILAVSTRNNTVGKKYIFFKNFFDKEVFRRKDNNRALVASMIKGEFVLRAQSSSKRKVARN